MKKLIIVLFLSALLLFGCTGPATQETQQPGQQQPAQTQEPAQGEPEPACDATYAFSELGPATLSGVTTFTITATCAKGKDVALYLNGERAGGLVIPNNEPTILNFDIAAKVDGESTVSVKSDAETVHSEKWTVNPIGSSDTSGKDYDQASNKKWLAVAFDVESPISVGSIGGYIKRLESQTLQDSSVTMEIRMDDNGKPAGAYSAVSSRPITDTTLSDNWMYFNYEGVTLQPGRYWAVLSVTKDEPTIVGDAVTLHYVAPDKNRPANDGTLQMDLVWSDTKRVWEESQWKPLPFDKTYSLVVSSQSR